MESGLEACEISRMMSLASLCNTNKNRIEA
jgi:hypothetical protein